MQDLGENAQNAAPASQNTTEPTQTTPNTQSAPVAKKKYVFAQNVLHNGVSHEKGDHTDDLSEVDFKKLLASGLIVEYVKPKTKRDIQKAISNGEKGFNFVRNVLHNGVEYTQGQSADSLSEEMKEDFISKGFVQFQ